MEVGIPCWHTVAWCGERWDGMFQGCCIHSVDDKNRICLPARLRQAISDPVMLTKGPDGCLLLLVREQWQVLLDKAVASSSMQRFFIAPACEYSPGQRGRLALPLSLRLHADIKPGSEVAIVGIGKRVEIWSLARWEAASSRVTTERVREELPEIFVTH